MRSFLSFWRSRLTWYVMGQVLGPTAIGFVTYTFLLLLRAVFVVLEQILVRGVSARDAFMLLWYSLPHVVVLTVPMSFLFGVLLAVGRMSAENEIVALQAGGVSMRRLVYPVLVLGLVLSGANAYLTLDVMPRFNRKLVEMKVRLFSSAKSLGEIEPKVFYQELPNTLLYVRGVDAETGVWKGVLLFERGRDGKDTLVVARRGRLVRTAPPGAAGAARAGAGGRWLLLDNAVSHELNERKPQMYRVNVNQSQLVQFGPKPGANGRVQYSFGLRAQSTAQLVRTIGRAHRGREEVAAGGMRTWRLAEVELQKRLAIPMACLVFGLIGFPLAVRSRSGGKGRGFLVSLMVIVGYYIVLNQGELLSREGRIPAWVGAWLPNLLVVVIGLGMMARAGMWLGERARRRSLIATLTMAVGERVDKRRHRQATGTGELRLTGSIPVALQRRRPGLAFPGLLDRYLLRRLAGPLLLVLTSSAALYIVVDFADKLDELAKHTATLGVFFAYYWNLLPQVVLDVAPLGFMISVLLLLTLLERNMELTAIKAGGISLYRVVVPVLVAAGMLATGLAVLQESVVPRSNREAHLLLNRIKGRRGPRSFAGTDRQWLFSRDGSTLYNFLRYDRNSKTLFRLSLYRFDEDDQLRFMLFADRARYRNGSWIADSGWFRQIYPDGTDSFQRITKPMELDVPEAPSYFVTEYRTPAEMTFGQLRRYIAELKVSGYRPIQLLVRLYQKITYPLSAFVMVFLALPFGLNRSGGRRVSPVHGIAWGLGLGMVYFLLVAVFGKLGEANVLPPLVGAWIPLVLATLFAVNRLTTVRT